MADLSITAPVIAPQVLTPATGATSAAELARRGKIHETARSFEASFLSSMLQSMFDGTEVSAPFGGGPGETMFRSVLTEAMAKQVTKAGGVGVAASVEREMLKLQGLT
jgi:Rod binding domain-containing protein